MNLPQVAELVTILILVAWNVWQYISARKGAAAHAKTLSDIKEALDGFTKRLGPVAEVDLDANPLRCQIHKESIDKLVSGQERTWKSLDALRDRIAVTEGDIKAVKVKCGLD